MSLEDAIEAMPSSKEVARLKKRIRDLESLVEKQCESIERSQRSSIRIPLGRTKGGRKPSAFVRVIIPDTHGAHIDLQAVNAFLSDLEELNPQQIVMLGDHLDCGGWLAQHQTLGFVPETDYTYEDDCNAANQFLDEIAKRARAKTWYISGNHEARLEKSIIKMTLGSQRDSAWMLRMWGCPAVLNLEKRGIEWVGRDALQDGLKVRGAIKLGKCFFTHGKAVGINSTHRTLMQFKANVCHGHNHRMAHASVQSAETQMIGAWCFGCLCKMQPLYYDTNCTDWAHGYGIQFVEADGSFTTWAIPIIDGRSRLRLLLNRKGK